MSAIVRSLARTGGAGLPVAASCAASCSAPAPSFAALRTSPVLPHTPSCTQIPSSSSAHAHAAGNFSTTRSHTSFGPSPSPSPSSTRRHACGALPCSLSPHSLTTAHSSSNPSTQTTHSSCSLLLAPGPPPSQLPARLRPRLRRPSLLRSTPANGQVGPPPARKPHAGGGPPPHHKGGQQGGKGGAAAAAAAVDDDEEDEEDGGLEELDEEAGQKLAPYMDAVVKVYCIHTEPHYSLPWQRKRQASSSSSGFVVAHAGRTWLLTNAHSVDYHTQVKVKRRGDDRKYLARVLSVGVDCDIAALHVEDPEFWAGLGLQPPQLGPQGPGPQAGAQQAGQQQQQPAEVEAAAQRNGPAAKQQGAPQPSRDGSSGGGSGGNGSGSGGDNGGGVPVLELGPLPRLQDGVAVVGYPIGGDTISVTAGVVSRIEVTDYSHGSTELLAIQIDAAINGGNSGGPVFNKACQCVGIAFQALSGSDVENVGYVIPTPVVTHFLDDYLHTASFSGFPALGISWQRMESEALRAAYGMTPGQKGVLVRAVNPTAAAAGVLKPDDVLMAFDGVRIAGDGTVPFRTGERIGFSHLVSNKFVGDEAGLQVLRGGRRMELKVRLSKPTVLVPPHLSNRDPPYLIVGGLVFTPASEPYLQSEYGAEYGSEAPVKLLDRLYHGYPQTPDEEVVVLSQVLACDATLGYEDVCNVQLRALNGTRVRNLMHLAQLLQGELQGQAGQAQGQGSQHAGEGSQQAGEGSQQAGGEQGQQGSQADDGGSNGGSSSSSSSSSGRGFLRFDLDYNEVVVLQTEDVLRVTPEVLRSHSIPHDMSPDLRAQLTRLQQQGQGRAEQQQGAKQGKEGAEGAAVVVPAAAASNSSSEGARA